MELSKMPPYARRAISGIEVESVFAGSGDNRKQIGVLKKIRISPKIAALEKLGDHLGLFTKRVELTGEGGGPVEIAPTDPLYSDTDFLKAVQQALERTGRSTQ